MKNALTLLFAVGLLAGLSGCPKRAPNPDVTGTSEERLDQYASKLEELRVRAQTEQLSCDQKCELAKQTCELSKQVCDLTTEHADLQQQRCTSAQEQCAQANDACSSCR